MSASIGAAPERALIDRIRARAARQAPGVLIGIGDDAAVLEAPRGHVEVITTDVLVEHVHFRRDWTASEHIGYKALAVNLSDLAAMGAMPRAALLSLSLPAEFPLADFDALIAGFLTLAAEARVALIGGNIARSPGPAVVDVTAIGYARPRRLLRRGTAQAGDELYVTGWPGLARTGLAVLEAGISRVALDPDLAACVARFERPAPRWREASTVARSGGASAAMDLSDGLADAARQMADASGIGVVIRAADVPIAPGVRRWAETHGGAAPLDAALSGGEDYELAFAVAARQRRRFRAALHRYPDLPVTCVGTFVDGPDAVIDHEGVQSPLPSGFTHFGT